MLDLHYPEFEIDIYMSYTFKKNTIDGVEGISEKNQGETKLKIAKLFFRNMIERNLNLT